MLPLLRIPERLLATGPNGGGLAILPTTGGVAELHDASMTGLAAAEGVIAWCEQGVGSRIVVCRDGKLRGTSLADDDLDVHDLVLDGQAAWLVATRDNAICRWADGRLETVRRFADEPDSWHLNSLVRLRGRWLASHFGRFDQHRGYKGRTGNAGEVVDVETGEPWLQGLSQPHSLVADGDDLWLCNSEAAELLRVRDGKVIDRWAMPGYTRGLAIGADHVYVGISLSRNAPAAGDSGFGSAVVAVVRRADGVVEGVVPLPWREIYDLRLLPDDGTAAGLMTALASSATLSALPLRRIETKLGQVEGTVVQALSGEIRHMQQTAAAAMHQAGEAQARASLADQLASRLDLLQQDVARQASVLADALADARAREARLEVAEAGLADAQARRDALEHALAASRAELEQARAEAIAADARANEAAAQVAAALRQAETSEAKAAAAVAQARTAEAGRLAARAEARSAQARARDLEADEANHRHALAAARMELNDLREAARQLELVLSSRSWRWTRPLRAAGRLVRGHWQGSDRDHLLHALRNVVARAPMLGDGLRSSLVQATLPSTGCALRHLPGPGELHLVGLAAPVAHRPDIYIGGVVDWHFRTQRPQHLARALARRGHRVFYLSNNFHDAATPGFRVEPLGEDDRLFQVHLNLAGRPSIYLGMPSPLQRAALMASVGELLAWTGTSSSHLLVQHPFWQCLARRLPSSRLVYDCMDHHGGFDNNSPDILAAEDALVEGSDLLVVTSDWLEASLRPRARAMVTVRNAAEYEVFAQVPAQVHADPAGRAVIGYFGAIAEWFDVDLVRAVAVAFPQASVVLVGSDTANVGGALADLPNVRMVGEVPYEALPAWLHGFDACLLPFRRIPLTLATNPVKVYEYLASGKPVVSVDLPEMRQFGDLVSVAADAGEFVEAIGRALAEPADDPRRAARQAFAAGQTWAHRADALGQALDSLDEPRVSVVVLTWNNLAFTEACLFSLEAYSDYRNLEIIVVDNASTDGSREWLQRWAAEPSEAGHHRRLVLNDRNAGFAAGNNIGLKAATGDILVMLNNDTYVTPGWVRGLANHLRSNPGLGLVGPVTNNIGNEARIEIQYADMADMILRAGAYTRAHPGRLYRMRTAAFFCVAMRRDTFDRVGLLDEAFGQGFFEDDDYCRRVEQAGLEVACAEDVFVHHHLSASFDALRAERRQALFEANKALYEEKWGTWVPHGYRPAGAGGVRA